MLEAGPGGSSDRRRVWPMDRQRRGRRSGVGRGWGLSRQWGVPALPPPIPPRQSSVAWNSQAFTPSDLILGSLETPTRRILPCLAHNVSKRLDGISHSRTPPQPRPRTLSTSTFRATSSRKPPHFPFLRLG